MKNSKPKRIFAAVSEDTWDKFLAKARLQHTTGQDLLAQWVDRYLGANNAENSRLQASEKRWVDVLLSILRSGDPGAIHAVTSNLIQFERVLKLEKEVELAKRIR